jgi:hypothetical protein
MISSRALCWASHQHIASLRRGITFHAVSSSLTKIQQPMFAVNSLKMPSMGYVKEHLGAVISTHAKKAQALGAGSLVLTMDSAAEFVGSPIFIPSLVFALCMQQMAFNPNFTWWHRAVFLESGTTACWAVFFVYYHAMPFMWPFWLAWMMISVPKFIYFLELSRPTTQTSTQYPNASVTLKRLTIQ